MRPEPKPWGFAAHVWQAWVFVLAGLLALTNAAWFYNMRTARVEAAAAAPAPEPRRVERIIYQTPDGRPVAAPRPAPVRVREQPAAPTPLQADEQCIGNTRFKVTGDTWTNVGRC